jgi:replicative DNA helicase
LPYLQEDYFRNTHEKVIFRHINEFVSKYKTLPTPEIIQIAAESDVTVIEDTFKEVAELLTNIKSEKEFHVDDTWLIEHTEKFCQDKALANAAYATVAILEGKDKKQDSGAIPGIFEDALSISFDPSIGHDYFEDAEDRYDKLHSKDYKIAFDIEECNLATKGGVKRKTLNLLSAGVHVGKTLGLCHLAKSYMVAGKNVLYITLEISEEDIGFRIDCNLLHLTTDDADLIPKNIFLQKVERVRKETPGKLIIKEYPAGSVHINHFRALLHELKLKINFDPDVIIVDYLGLCASSRIKMSENTHITIQAIAEELRSLAQELDKVMWSAAQLDAQGMKSSDPGMTNLSQSKVGLPATVDLLWIIVVNEKLLELGQALVIQQKNRYRDLSDRRKFYIGIDRKKMRWYDVAQKGQLEEDADADPLKEEEEMKRQVSKKYGQEAYQSAYKTFSSTRKGKNGLEFGDFKV